MQARWVALGCRTRKALERRRVVLVRLASGSREEGEMRAYGETEEASRAKRQRAGYPAGRHRGSPGANESTAGGESHAG
jgi:hypothetical protein